MMSSGASLAAIGAAFAADPLGSTSLTAPQAAWVLMGSPDDPDLDGRPLLWLGANQIGKSYAQAAKLLHYLRATGPYALRRAGPVHICIVSISKEQIVPLMSKIWDLLPKETGPGGELRPTEAPTARFEPGFGIRGKPPRLNFKSGKAAGSTVTFATYRQGSTRIAGATLDVLMLDEPPPESLWGEVALRIMRRAGQIWITMTVTPDSPPQEWLAEKVERGGIRAMTTPSAQQIDGRWIADVTPFKPVDGSPAFLRKKELQGAIDVTPEAERALRFGAAWTGSTVDRWLSAWSPDLVVDQAIPAGCIGVLSLDHGIRPGRQAAVLLAFHKPTSRFWVLDEVAGGDVATSSQQDALNIAEMLRRNGIGWEAIDHWIGDRSAAATRGDARKDNATLRRYLAAHLGVQIDRFPRINVPYKAAGTLTSGFRQLNALYAAKTLLVHPRCKHVIKSSEGWNGDKRSPLKDVLDALRYGVETCLTGYNMVGATLVQRTTR